MSARLAARQRMGLWVSKNRVNAGLSRAELADLMGRSEQTLGNWENGKNMLGADAYLRMQRIFKQRADERKAEGASVFQALSTEVAA